ncbi:helix-turn-helix domain-containing protein [Sphingobium olei]|uniref:Helix-turn-helix domain-containing protein n=1 Tax=Sphingobium olei TaxID=420955 RepID=A0ABW3NTU4_9SPHN|nr:helix-turn-helix domain-containing protein [Sphingobium sp.]
MMTPGTYLKLRRVAAGLTLMDVAAMVSTNPRYGEIDKVAWIDRIERDIAALSPDVIATLADAFRFSRQVLLRLITLRSYGPDAGEEPRICHLCGCTEHDACLDQATGHGCAWSGPDTCTSCTGKDLPHAA